MNNYSENWQHLKSILIGYATRNRRSEFYSYSNHTHAKALSIFLAQANLATPKLDRLTVEAVLAGRQVWPHTLNTPTFEGVSLQLSLLEEYGLVTFYAGWCSVHCQSPISPEKVDQSLIPLIQAVEHLKDICLGRNGYIQPHYACPEDVLKKLLAAHFGSATVAELLPELRLEDDHYNLPSGNQNFSSLVSTHLWRTLYETLDPRDAFHRWILCLRVNCDWAFPVLFGDDEHEQRTEFNNQLLAYISQDTSLSISTDTLLKQVINIAMFSNIVMPISTRVNLTFKAGGESISEHKDIIELEKPTLDSLSMAYPLPSFDESCDLEFVRSWQRSGHWQEPNYFYTWLLGDSIEASVRIDRHLLASYGFTERLLELTGSRLLLKHLLFNVIPDYERVIYKIFLLSQVATCDIAIFYLTQQSFSNPHRDVLPFTQNFDKGYRQLVCHEYLRTIEKEPDSGDRLLRVVGVLGERCDLNARDFAKSHEYEFLLCLLDSLSHQRVAQLGRAFSQRCEGLERTSTHPRAKHYWYFLGFWLMERLENVGIDHTGTLTSALRIHLLGHYKTELEESLTGKQCGLDPNDFFSALPWHKMIGDKGVSQLLELSSRCSDWQAKLSYLNKGNFAVASAIRHYLQVLMCVGRPQIISQDGGRVASRVIEIVRTLGFGPREEATYLFDAGFYADKFDLWSSFCSYVNLLKDELYDELVERTLPLIPLNQLFVLFERCTVISRTQKLQEMIANRQSLDPEDLGLSGLEQAFISAWDADHIGLASKLIDKAKGILAQERFSRTNNPSVLRARKAWLGYEYKWQLLKILNTFKEHPDEYAEAARQVPIPQEFEGNSRRGDDRGQWQECERFRRYIIAAAYCETDPAQCIRIMEQLYKEAGSRNFSFMLFKGRLALYEIDKDITGLRSALSELLDSFGDAEPGHMPTLWIATILDAYRQLQDRPGIDSFWSRLNPDQKARRETMRPYCLALMGRGDALIAQQIITRYRELNLRASDELGITDLIDELGKVLPSEHSLSQLIQVVNEESQRGTVQLRKHYSQIVSKEFEDYVDIVGQGLLPHEFLKEVVMEVAKELLLRKKNLQLHSNNSNGKTNIRITQEDLINDWFTSLFDKRLADARIGFRDQKRGGQSVSGKRPGEIDGYITDAKNKRISIFEAFRLFSLDTTVIFEHLNKIAGYDNESLSPIFIVAYCDISDFEALSRDYSSFIASQSYAGFTINSAKGSIQTMDSTDHIWIGMERRWRNRREIIFYHLLLNMRSEG